MDSGIALIEHLNDALALLKDYEKWEADVILENKCWGIDNTRTSPILTEAQWDKLIDLQEKRNKILYGE